MSNIDITEKTLAVFQHVSLLIAPQCRLSFVFQFAIGEGFCIFLGSFYTKKTFASSCVSTCISVNRPAQESSTCPRDDVPSVNILIYLNLVLTRAKKYEICRTDYLVLTAKSRY